MVEYRDKNVVAIDTATARLKLALQFAADRLVKLDEDVGTSHGQVLVKKIGQLLESAGLGVEELQAMVVSTGPGSFTGLRIGLAAAKGIAAALDIPVAGVSLFDVAAAKLGARSGDVWVIVPFKKDAFFMAVSSSGDIGTGGVSAVSASELRDTIGDQPLATFAADLPARYPELNWLGSGGLIDYDASDILSLGVMRLSAAGPDDLADLEPMYVQKSVAEMRFAERKQHK